MQRRIGSYSPLTAFKAHCCVYSSVKTACAVHAATTTFGGHAAAAPMAMCPGIDGLLPMKSTQTKLSRTASVLRIRYQFGGNMVCVGYARQIPNRNNIPGGSRQ